LKIRGSGTKIWVAAMLAAVITVLTACPNPRNVYIDAGVNWCNTLELFRKVPPELSAPLPSPWHVFGFEAMPKIVPFADKCAAALSVGLPLPPLPIPATGSSKDLARVARQYGCTQNNFSNETKTGRPFLW
jgi:hypothetical protein